MAAFGWSAGDVFASIQLVAKIAGALRESGGAKSEYRESIDFLFGLEITLQNLRSIAPVIITPSQQEILQLEAEKIARPLSDFFGKVQKFDAALGLQSKRGAWRTAPRKVQWAMCVSQEVKTLRDRISVPISSLNILLQSQILDAISKLHEKLPDEVSDSIASSIETAVSSGLKHELDALRHSAERYREMQNDLTQDVGCTLQNNAYDGHSPHLFLKEETGQTSEHDTRYLESQELTKSPDSRHENSRVEQLLQEQSNELKMLNASLTTIAKFQGFPASQSSKEVIAPSKSPMSELKVTFARCIYLLALSLRELFEDILLRLGPQFLLFLLVFKQFGSNVPRLLFGDSILFEDVLGRRKYLPVEFFQHYNVFNTFLRESFEGVPGQRYVMNRQYQLNDANNNVVDSSKWLQTVAKRSKVTMSIILDKVTDREVVCPRCWMSESVARPGMNVQCSSCDLIYKHATSEELLHEGVIRPFTPVETHSENSGGAQTTTTEGLANAPSTKGLEEWGVATVTSISTASVRLKSPDSALETPHNTQGLPWDYEDLVHFKRVQIAESESQTLPRTSALNRLILVFARLREEILKAKSNSRSIKHEQMQGYLDILISRLESCSKILSVILHHPSFAFLSQDADLDRNTQLWSRAWTNSTYLMESSEKLFREAIRMCQELKLSGILELVKGDLAPQRAEMLAQFVMSSTSFKASLDVLLEIDSAWTLGGQVSSRQIESPQSRLLPSEAGNKEYEGGIATALEVTSTYIIVALKTGTISIFSHDNSYLRPLIGHVKGVWVLAAHEDILVSGGVDRDVRVWDMRTGETLHALKGHTATVRSLKRIDGTTVISGSRDTTMRIWDIKTGLCKHILVGHQASVRCLAVYGDICVSGSYDTTARIWSVSEARHRRTLSGHSSQIHCIAFDGQRVVTGSWDTSVRIWDVTNGSCQAILMGHTSLVGQLQLHRATLVTGGSDGSIRVWSLQKMAPIHRLAAAENSITGLAFDHRRIVSGSSDGRVKVWDLRSGNLIRELGTPTDTVWQLYLGETMAVTLRSQSNKISVEIWSFSNSASNPEHEMAK